jgi:mannose/fructose/N-acetylgalactosamine-specific phosphotransferase system component IIB
MSIVLARIDNRLIHGQVLEAWVPSINADCIVVANNQVAGITFQKVLMEAAVPKRIRVFIGTVEDAAQALASQDLQARRVLLLFANSEDALKAHRLGIDFSYLNLGNMHGGEGKMRLTCTIALDPSDIENLKNLEDLGVRIVSQCIPSDRQQSWRKLIPNKGA